MRTADKKVQVIARETGMLYMVGTTEYSRPVTVGDLTIEFEYETPDTETYIEVYQDGKRRAVNSYSSQELDQVRIDYPQFFQDDWQPCTRCNDEMRIIDYSLQVNGGSDKYENDDGKMPCPDCQE